MTFNMYWLHHSINLLKIVPFLGGWLSDRLLGDPEGWPHPIVWFGKAISAGEKELNKGSERVLKGGILAVVLILGVYLICERILSWAWIIHPQFSGLLTAVGVFYCLSGKTLIKEVKAVFEAVDRSTEEGRRQVARIVGRDTSNLSPQEIRAAALETLSENLSDGVIAPMFWFALLGLPGMMAYKMVNTLDSMIGYKNERYLEFGRIAALIDDIANYIPARLTAYLMLLVSNNWGKRDFVRRFGPEHASPNSGYPEAALAAVLDCQFGGTHDYFGKPVEKPYIGTNARPFTTEDMRIAIQVNSNTELLMGVIVTLIFTNNIILIIWEIRLNKLISEAGVCSRREADNFIEMETGNRNGKQPHVGQKVTAEDVVLVDGERLNVEKYIRLQEEEKRRCSKKKNYSARSGKRNPRTREAVKALKWRSSESSINTLPPVRRRKREAGNPRPPSLPTRRSYCEMPYAPSSERH